MTLSTVAAESAAVRDDAGRRLVEQAPLLTRAALDLATRLHAGGRLYVVGDGPSHADAAHVAVEFLHPVIVGKPAIAAVAVTGDTTMPAADRLRVLARPADALLAFVTGPAPTDQHACLDHAGETGMLSVALATAATVGPGAAGHVIDVGTTDARIAKEMFVTCYHLLWELGHVFLDQLGGSPRR